MAPAGKKPCAYVDAGCTWTTPHHALITTRAKTKADMRTHASERFHNPMTGENRQCKQAREEANERRRAKAEPRRENPRQEESDEPTRRSCQGEETAKGDLPERNRQGQGATTNELPKGNYQGQGVAKKTPGETGHCAARECPRHTSTHALQPPRGNTRERIPSESRTSRREVGSSEHELSNSSSEFSSPPEPKGAGRLMEKSPGTVGGKPSGESDKPDARERETIGDQGTRSQSAQSPKGDMIR